MTQAERVAEIKERAEKATPGPWKWVETPSAHTLDSPANSPDKEWDGITPLEIYHAFDKLQGKPDSVLWGNWCNDSTADVGVGEADAAFIFHAREDVPYLLALVADLQKEIKDMRSAGEHERVRRHN
jgi:hypothetical protein